MSGFQSKITRHDKEQKNMTHNKEKKKTRETSPEQINDRIYNKCFKKVIITVIHISEKLEEKT